MYSNAMQATPGVYQSPDYKSQRKVLHEWAKAEGYSDYQYFDMVVKVEELVRKGDGFAHMAEEWIQYNIDYHVYDKLFGSKYGQCEFPKPTCREARETNPSQQGIGRGGNTSRGGHGGGGGSTKANQQGLNQPPNNVLANMSSSEKDKAEHSNKAPAGAPTGPRAAQRSGISQRNGVQNNQPPREGRVRALQAIEKEEEKIVEKVADSNTVSATLAPMNVDRVAEDSSEEESFVIHKVHEETLVPDSTGKMVPVADLLKQAELRGAKNAMKEAKRKQAAEAVKQSHDVRDMLPEVEGFEESNQRKKLNISPTIKEEEEEEVKGAAVSDAVASRSI